jgi:glycosyltransferase involved in cell wall biosynthesis
MSKVSVLHITTHDEDCGIAKYQQNFISAMAESGDSEIHNEIFHFSPNKTKTMGEVELDAVVEELKQKLQNFDVLHIQHEFGFYYGNELQKYAKVAKDLDKKLVFTVHTSPDVVIHKAHLPGFGPRSFVLYVKQKRHTDSQIAKHITPMQVADVVIAHNQPTIDSLIDFGVDKDKIVRIQHPVPSLVGSLESNEIRSNLNYKKGDIIYATVGFMHKYKGLFDAVKALRYLPQNYKLAIIGGVHPFSDSAGIYNKITDMVADYGLQDRVYITGFVKDDNRLNALIQECTVCVYPYDGVYYGKTSSGALNLAFANSMPVIAYPTETIREIAADSNGAAVLTDSFSYYELARKLQSTDYDEKAKQSVDYAKKMAWPVQTKGLVDLYSKLITNP